MLIAVERYDSPIAVDKFGSIINLNVELYDKEKLGYIHTKYLGYRADEKNVYIKYRLLYSRGSAYSGDPYEFCYHKPTDPYEYEVKFEYLGNGKFSDGVISKVTTIAEYDEANANINCSDRNN